MGDGRCRQSGESVRPVRRLRRESEVAAAPSQSMQMEAFDEGVLAEIYVQKGDLLRQLQAQRRLREEIVFPKNAFDGAPVSVPRDLQFIPAKINI
jgi:hypothetical protein